MVEIACVDSVNREKPFNLFSDSGVFEVYSIEVNFVNVTQRNLSVIGVLDKLYKEVFGEQIFNISFALLGEFTEYEDFVFVYHTTIIYVRQNPVAGSIAINQDTDIQTC